MRDTTVLSFPLDISGKYALNPKARHWCIYPSSLSDLLQDLTLDCPDAANIVAEHLRSLLSKEPFEGFPKRGTWCAMKRAS